MRYFNIELLTPDDRVRAKAKDIFDHPWIKKYEKRLSDASKEEVKTIVKEQNKVPEKVIKKEDSKPKLENKIPEPVKLEKKESKQENKLIISNKPEESGVLRKNSIPKINSAKNVIQIPSGRSDRKGSNNDEKEQERQNLIKNINQKKETSINEAINTSVNDFSLLNINNQSDNLFDKVLLKVRKVNMGKIF
mgnify:CR=1 FL=1